MAASTTRSSVVRILWTAAAVGFCLLAIGLIALKLIPFEIFLRIARAATGSGRPIDLERYSILAPRLLPSGLFYGLLGGSMLVARRRLVSAFSEAVAAAGGVLAGYWRSGRLVLLSEDRMQWVPLTLVMLSGVLLRLLYIGEPPRADESATYLDYAGRSIVHVLTLYAAPNNHVLHSLLVWISVHLFGNSPQALRLPVLIAGILLIPLVYIFARRLSGTAAGLCAAGLVAISGPLILFSCDARGYMLQAVLLMVMLNLAINLSDEESERSKGFWLLFILAAVAGFWTSPTMLYGYLAASLWLIWNAGRRVLFPLVVATVLAAAFTVFLYMPILVVSGPRALLANPWVRPLPLDRFWFHAEAFPGQTFEFLHGGDPAALAIAIAAGALISVIMSRTLGKGPARLFVVTCGVVLAVSSAQRIVPFPRVLIPLIPVYYVAAGSGWAILARMLALKREPVFAVGVLLVLCGCGWRFTRSGYMESNRYFPDSPIAARYLAKELRTCDRLLISLSAGAPLGYELRRFGVKYSNYLDGGPDVGDRILVAVRRIDGPLPQAGDGLLNPEYLTLPGTIVQAEVPAEKFTAPRMIYSNGTAQVFEMDRLPVRDGEGAASRNCPAVQ
jgi:hypothetical protein